MSKITRISMTFPSDLLEEFDKITAEMGYTSRSKAIHSKAIQDAVRSFISEHKWLREEEGSYAGVLMMLYDHEVKGLEHELTHIQHEYTHLISSSMHVVRGEASEIKALQDQLSTKRGVKIVKLLITAI